MTDLLTDQCGCRLHRNSPELDVVLVDGMSIVREFTARFDGRCAVDVSHPISDGDRCGFTDEGVVACPLCVSRILRYGVG